MNFKDFLVDNYLWIILIIVLSIVTVIGCLADKKKAKKERPDTMGGNIQNPGIGNNNMAYQPQQNINNPISFGQTNGVVGNNMQYNPSVAPLPSNPVNSENNMITPTNNIVSPMPTTPVPEPISMPQPAQNSINEMNYNVPGPVESINAMINNQPEPLYQPLSEQKPSFNPVEPNINMMNNQMASVVSEPVINPVPIQPIVEPMNIQPTSVVPNQTDGMNIAQGPMATSTPSPIPASPMPNQGGNTIPNPITPPQPVAPQPISFTYGNQNNSGSMQQ